MAAPTYPAICPGHQKGVVELHYGATAGGADLFVSACLDRLPMLRDGATGDWVGTFQGHKGAVWSAKLSPGCARAATGSADFTAKVWDACTGDEVATLEHGHVVRSVDWSPDGSRLATGGADRQLRVFDAADLAAQPLALDVGAKIRAVVWARDGARVLTGTEDGSLRWWDVGTRACVAERRVDAPVADVELSRDGTTLTVSAGRCVHLLDAGTLAVRATHTLPFQVESASLHPATGAHFVAGGDDMRVHLRDASTGAEAAPPLRGHHGAVHCVRFAPGGATFASGADDAIIRIWRYDAADVAATAAAAAAVAAAAAGAAPAEAARRQPALVPPAR